MGNIFTEDSLWIEADELSYYSTEQQRNVGTVDILTSNHHLPMSYIMRLEQPLEEGAELLELYRQIGRSCSPSMIKLYDCRKVQKCGCSSTVHTVRRLESYWEFYNFYLSDLIERRQKRNAFFAEDELWYLVKVCCQGISILRDHGILIAVDPNQLVVTPEGKLRLFWAHILPRNSHLGYFKCLLFGEKAQGCYSPEELESIRNQQFSQRHSERSVRLDLEKSQVFTFGLCLFYCATLVDPAHFYIKTQALDFNQLFATLKTYKQKHIYSPLLWQLIEDCLRVEPAHRPSFRQVQHKYASKLQDDCSYTLSMSGTSGSQFEHTEADGSLSQSPFNRTRISLRKQADGGSAYKSKSQFSDAK